MPSARRALSTSPSIFHARHEHGGHPVHAYGLDTDSPTYEVHWPEGPVTYPSARKLLKALYNHGDTSPQARDPRMTFRRYFHVDRLGVDEAGPTIFDLFSPSSPTTEPRVPVRARGSRPSKRRRPCPASAGRWYKPGNHITAAFSTLALFGSLELAEAAPIVVEPTPFAWADEKPQLSIAPTEDVKGKGTTLTIAPTVPLGIDLAARGHEVRKLLFKGFGGRMARKGFDPEDVLQEVFLGLMARNKGKCPFDARKSSFGHYVHMVCGCILSNYQRKEGRRREHEQVGMYSYAGEEEFGRQQDAALGAVNQEDCTGHGGPISVEASISTDRAFSSLLTVLEENGLDKHGKVRPEAELAAQCLPLVYEGHQRAEIARQLGEDPSKVGRALSYLRKTATVWRETQFA